jgi:hypothetical protein
MKTNFLYQKNNFTKFKLLSIFAFIAFSISATDAYASVTASVLGDIDEAKKIMRAKKFNTINMNVPNGEWILYKTNSNTKIYFEKIKSNNQTPKRIRFMEVGNRGFKYPIYIESQRVGSSANAKAFVNEYKLNCSDGYYELVKKQFLGGDPGKFNVLATYVRNDRIFDYSIVFRDLSQEFGGYEVSEKAGDIWTDFYAWACIN